MNWYIWIVAALAYVIFAAWYFNWKGPLKAAEIDQYLKNVQENSGGSPTDPEVLRKFMERDDGKEFVMLNLIRFNAIDSWNTAADEGFQVVSVMRYRSRRDLMSLVSDPRFNDSHKFKLAAIDGTTSFPMQLWVPLLLLLLASLAQNAIFIFELRK